MPKLFLKKIQEIYLVTKLSWVDDICELRALQNIYFGLSMPPYYKSSGPFVDVLPSLIHVLHCTVHRTYPSTLVHIHPCFVLHHSQKFPLFTFLITFISFKKKKSMFEIPLERQSPKALFGLAFRKSRNIFL